MAVPRTLVMEGLGNILFEKHEEIIYSDGGIVNVAVWMPQGRKWQQGR